MPFAAPATFHPGGGLPSVTASKSSRSGAGAIGGGAGAGVAVAAGWGRAGGAPELQARSIHAPTTIEPRMAATMAHPWRRHATDGRQTAELRG